MNLELMVRLMLTGALLAVLCLIIIKSCQKPPNNFFILILVIGLEITGLALFFIGAFGAIWS